MANNTLRERLARGRMEPLEALDATILLGSWLYDAEYQNNRDSYEEISPDTVEFDADGRAPVPRSWIWPTSPPPASPDRPAPAWRRTGSAWAWRQPT